MRTIFRVEKSVDPARAHEIAHDWNVTHSTVATVVSYDTYVYSVYIECNSMATAIEALQYLNHRG